MGVLIMFIVFPNRAIAQDCYETLIISPSPFMGNNEEIFKLSDGSLWKVKYEYEYLYEYNPSVVICPNLGKLIVAGNSLNVEFVAAAPGSKKAGSRQTEEWEIFEETNLKGSISGTVRRGRIFKTMSGSIYEVTGLTLQLVLLLQPEVTVLRNDDIYKLIVKGFDEPLLCKCLNCSSAKRNTAPRNEPTTQDQAVIESQIDGDFEGWEGETIVKLMNGQIWQQSEYYYHYHYSFMPKVVIFKSGSGYKIKVDGVERAVGVTKLR